MNPIFTTLICITFLTIFIFCANLPDINQFSENVLDSLDTLLDQLGMNKTLSDLLNDLPNMNKELDQVRDCFESELPNGNQNSSLNIFDGNLSFASIVKVYYDVFFDNSISIESITNLLNSTRQIIQHCLDESMSEYNSTNSSQSNKSKLKYGFTSLSDKSDDYIRRMLGVKSNVTSFSFNFSSLDPQPRQKRLTDSDKQCQPSNSQELPESFDWRDRDAVTPPKQQGSCGSCWAFATVGAIESAYLIHNRTDDQKFDLSEQQLVDCASPMFMGCSGGSSYMSFPYVKKNGLASEEAMPYRARSSFCFTYFKSSIAHIDDFCIRSRQRYSYSFETEKLSDQDIQKALVVFGPLYIVLNADPVSSKNYRGGIFNDSSCSERINHAVLLVGYTPDAWIIKNSWGTNWGEGGFFRLARGFNRCGINTEIAYPLLDDSNHNNNNK